MRKKKINTEEADKRLKRRISRNWIICAASLILIFICYYYVR